VSVFGSACSTLLYFHSTSSSSSFSSVYLLSCTAVPVLAVGVVVNDHPLDIWSSAFADVCCCGSIATVDVSLYERVMDKRHVAITALLSE